MSDQIKSVTLKEYQINLEMWRHYDNLRQEKNKTFLTANTILGAVIGVALQRQQHGSVSMIALLVSSLGLAVSALWFLLLSRNAAYITFHRQRVETLEPKASTGFGTFANQRAALTRHRWELLSSNVIDRLLAAFVAVFWLLLLVFRKVL
jgi:hypothetical protein